MCSRKFPTPRRGPGRGKSSVVSVPLHKFRQLRLSHEWQTSKAQRRARQPGVRAVSAMGAAVRGEPVGADEVVDSMFKVVAEAGAASDHARESFPVPAAGLRR